MEIISSVQNERIKAIAKLKTSKGRKEAGQFVVEGQRAVQSFIDNNYTPLILFVTEKQKNLTFSISCEIFQVTEPVLAKMSSATTPSGVLAVFALPPAPDIKTITAGIVLAEINDPGNMGTLIRSAAAFGRKSVVVIGGCDPFSPKVIQATAGTFPLISLFQCSWQELINNKKDLPLVGLALNGTQLDQTTNLQNSLLVVGNEAHGINPTWLKQCDQIVTLPMTDGVESLNAAVAGSIAMAYQFFH